MRPSLNSWVSDANALHHAYRLGSTEIPLPLSYLRPRTEDYYISLVGELFAAVREPYEDPAVWARLGNAIAQAANDEFALQTHRIPQADAALFAATAFYFGGFSASAYLTLRSANLSAVNEIQRSCYELLARPAQITTERVRRLVRAVRDGDLDYVNGLCNEISEIEKSALLLGPDEWIGWRLFERILKRFARTNIRAVLPDGQKEFWTPLVQSLIDRVPPVWDFFPSQIDAIKSGLLESELSYSIQMPTGAGKTALSETLIYYHLKKNPAAAAVLLVPYRSLASELRGSLVRRLNHMGLATRCAYAGTVPNQDEVRELGQTHAVIATPESLSGLLSADREFYNRVSLVICDEGHLIASGARGVGLELLIARMRGRDIGPPRFVFISAIVPNIEEVNAWLGGTHETIVQSDYRPAQAEFAVLRTTGSGTTSSVALTLHPHESESTRFSIENFLHAEDFRYRNPLTDRLITYSFESIKCKAIATARKALGMGAVAVFAANKRGNQGAVGLTQELIAQLGVPLPMPSPIQYISDPAVLRSAVDYLVEEYGDDWVGTKALRLGAVLHHGDIPQETREVLEVLLRRGVVRLAICTSTLAEGVNLPIRTLILYSIQRRLPNGRPETLLARDIKNLVGRAGRAGATTKGLVICANPAQWEFIEPIAKQMPSENVEGALLGLMKRLYRALSEQGRKLTNEILESAVALHPLTDGIDATLIDLAAEEIGEEKLVQMAAELAEQTFASRQSAPEALSLIRDVFELRARRIAEIRAGGHLGWIRQTGTRVRLLLSVKDLLLPLRDRWDDLESPTDPHLLAVFVDWAWEMPDMKSALAEACQGQLLSKDAFSGVLTSWIEGRPLVAIAASSGIPVDTILALHAKVLVYVFQMAVEQAIGILKNLLEANGQLLAKAVQEFPENLRFGVPTAAARILSLEGLRHRRAAVELGRELATQSVPTDDPSAIFDATRNLLLDRDQWRAQLGQLVLEATIEDLSVEGLSKH